ncbi:hypothetical protein HU200_057014 [Digitaria exilis]|uniref:Uncharacterized protein n=1 Tax=Digitaria exilis TaxID=1010633 RepID=A0A835AGA4_9POAL|nr:hypothetical protein HU200_057014 [Digitaria exilis]
MATMFNGDVCLLIPVLLSSESSPTMCHAELFREATGGIQHRARHFLCLYRPAGEVRNYYLLLRTVSLMY